MEKVYKEKTRKKKFILNVTHNDSVATKIIQTKVLYIVEYREKKTTPYSEAKKKKFNFAERRIFCEKVAWTHFHPSDSIKFKNFNKHCQQCAWNCVVPLHVWEISVRFSMIISFTALLRFVSISEISFRFSLPCFWVFQVNIQDKLLTTA